MPIRVQLNPRTVDTDELTRLMKDPRYATSELYRREVAAILAATDVGSTDPTGGIDGRFQAQGKPNSHG